MSTAVFSHDLSILISFLCDCYTDKIFFSYLSLISNSMQYENNIQKHHSKFQNQNIIMSKYFIIKNGNGKGYWNYLLFF